MIPAVYHHIHSILPYVQTYTHGYLCVCTIIIAFVHTLHAVDRAYQNLRLTCIQSIARYREFFFYTISLCVFVRYPKGWHPVVKHPYLHSGILHIGAKFSQNLLFPPERSGCHAIDKVFSWKALWRFTGVSFLFTCVWGHPVFESED